ncbi:serpin family protein [Radiobacillus sp. PE A8.2]|uniref:serpin family protein n=1 Tax=Radiobacillus sp. PE A8.2 TaxID=3380349 RepID=UPI00388CEDAA
MKQIIISFLILSYIILLVGCGQEEASSGLEIASDVEFGEEDYKKVVSPSNALGFDVLSKVEGNADGNVFISPTSLFMVLAMVYNGADGNTKEEMEKVMHVEGIDVNEINQANASLLTMLNNASNQVQLNIANAIWLNKEYHFEDLFSQSTRDYFNAEIEEIDMDDPSAPQIINDWVENATNKKIKNMVDNPLTPNLVSLLINAVHFKGGWTDEFDKKLTKDQPFYLEDGSTKEVALMSLQKSFAYLDNDDFQAISLPYGENEEMSMKVFLPKESVSLTEFKSMLTVKNWNNWINEFQYEDGTIKLPRFQIEYDVLLNDKLKELGMPSAFDVKSVNFSNMIKEDELIWISYIKQKTFLEVNEKGAEAAAATSVGMTDGAAPPSNQPFVMEVNRPFFIAITDEATGTILFMGSVFNPS